MKRFFSSLLVIAFMWGGVFSASAQEKRSTTVSLTEREVGYYDLSVSGVMPGDTISQEMTLNVANNNDSEIKLKYIAGENVFEPLVEAFTVSIYIEELDKTIYSGELKDLSVEDLFIKHSSRKQAIHYTFDFHMKEETGNECANKALAGVFVWSCESVATIPDGDVIISQQPAKDNVTVSPKTGEDCMVLQCVGCIAFVALAAFFFLLSKKKRRQHA